MTHFGVTVAARRSRRRRVKLVTFNSKRGQIAEANYRADKLRRDDAKTKRDLTKVAAGY